MDNDEFEVAIIGAGASGLMAAAILAKKGIKAVLLEKNHKIGRKILSTGAGKCNISNLNIAADFYNSSNNEKLKKILQKIPPLEILNFFHKDLGIITISDEKNRIFPLSQKAESVVFAFESFIKRKNIKIITSVEVKNILTKNGKFEIICQTIPHQWEKQNFKPQKMVIKAHNLILSCGGPSYPQIGGTFSGYNLAENLGHKIIKPKPVITPFFVSKPELSRIDGVRLTAETEMETKKGKQKIKEELLFTRYGISGPLALDISFYVNGHSIPLIEIDLIPQYSLNNIINFLKLRINESLKLSDFFYPIIDKKLADFLFAMENLNSNLKADIKKIIVICARLKKFKLFNLKPIGFEMAMSKSGGVPLDEIDENFQSLKAKNLFITGEMLDCVGKSGGYNLHFAWLSGYISGKTICNFYEN